MNASLDHALGAALGSAVRAATRLGGGDFAAAYRVALADGRVVFAKTHAAPPPGFFGREAADLAWLGAAAAVPVPGVLAASDEAPAFLALGWIEESRGGDEASFGRALARLHAAGAPVFGRTDRRTTGSLALPNLPCETWAEFVATQRLGPLVRRAGDGRHLPERVLIGLETVIAKLDGMGIPAEPPARLHGDLWAGNRLFDTSGRSWLIDPAGHGGHREFDLSMMQLFGGFGAEAFEAYHDELPLADGWEARVPLHQLTPLVVHAIKFGGSYVDATARAVDRTLGL